MRASTLADRASPWRARATAAFHCTSGVGSSRAARNVVWAPSSGSTPSAYTAIFRTPASDDWYIETISGTTASSPSEARAHTTLMTVSLSGSSSASVSASTVPGGGVRRRPIARAR